MDSQKKILLISIFFTIQVLLILIGFILIDAYKKTLEKQVGPASFSIEICKEFLKTVSAPPNVGSPDVIDKYKAAVKEAREAPFLEIKDCDLSPAVLKVKNNAELIVKNSGDKNHEISIHGSACPTCATKTTVKKTYIVGLRDEIRVPIAFDQRGSSFYGIGCNTKPGRPVGNLFVVNE